MTNLTPGQIDFRCRLQNKKWNISIMVFNTVVQAYVIHSSALIIYRLPSIAVCIVPISAGDNFKIVVNTGTSLAFSSEPGNVTN